MATVKVNYGMRSATEEFPAGTTVSDLLANQDLMAYLRVSDDVKVVVNGETLNSSDSITGYLSVTLEKQGSEKG